MIPLAWTLLFWLAAGLFAGWLYFEGVWRSARLLADGRRPALALLLGLGRLGLLAVALIAVARAGAGPLLAAALGLLAGRAAVMRRVRRGAP